MASEFDGLSIERQWRIDGVCREFEESRYDIPPPPLSSFIGRVPLEDRTETLRELLAIDFELRLAESDELPMTEYLQQFPDDTELIERVYREVFDSLSAATTRETTLPIQRLGDYRIIREVGRGGMGIVYEAEQVSLNRHVALKVLPQHTLADPQRRLRFEREAKAAAKLHHTNIVPVFGVGECDGQVYFVMQFIQGRALAEVLRELRQTAESFNRTPQARAQSDAKSATEESMRQTAESQFQSLGLHPETFGTESQPTEGAHACGLRLNDQDHWLSVAQIGVQVGLALSYAHGQGVLHRDIKPGNLLLDSQGTVWIADFGLAKVTDDEGLTQTGDLLGTVRYMAPETFQGKFDARSEVFSLGLTLYELLALRPAYDQTTHNALFEQARSARIIPLGQLNRDIPRDLQTIVHKAIEADPANRYQTAQELADDLQRVIADEPIHARRTSLVERWLRWSRRNKGLAGALSLLFVVLVATAVTSSIAAGHFRSLGQDLKLSVGDLRDANGKLTESRNAAINSERDAVSARNEADAATKAAQTTVADLHTDRGLLAAAQGDSASAMLWFANAALLAPHDTRRQAANRLRARNAMHESMLPIAMLRVDGAGPNYQQLEFHPDGRQILDLRLPKFRIWEIATEQPLVWTTALTNVAAAGWSPDGKRVAIGLSSGELRVCDVLTGTIIASIQCAGAVESLAFSRDGQRLASGGQVVQVWKLADSLTLEHEWPHPQSVYSLFFNTAGNRLVTACRDRQARVFAVGEKAQTSEPLFAPVNHDPTSLWPTPPVLINNDRQLITLMPNQRRIGWWDSETGTNAAPAIANLNVEYSAVVVAHPDGQSFFVAAIGSCENWSLDGVRRSLPHPHQVEHVAVSPDGRGMATACWDWKARLWRDVSQANPQEEYTVELPSGFRQVRWSNDGDKIAFGAQRGLQIWRRSATDSVVGLGQGWLAEHWRPRPSLDGRFATLGRWHETSNFIGHLQELTVIETATGQAAGPVIKLSEIVDSCLCADNKSVAIVHRVEVAGTIRGALSLYDITTGQPTRATLPLPSPPLSVAVRPNGAQDIATFCEDDTLLVFDQRDGTLRYEFKHLGAAVRSTNPRQPRVTYSLDGSALVALTSLDVVHVHDANSGILRFPAIRPVLRDGPCRSISISSDSQRLATVVNGENAVQVWDLATGAALSQPLPHSGEFYGIFTVAFSPDGSQVLTSHKDGRARLWNWKTGQLVCPPLQHPDEVIDVAFCSDGRHFLTATRNDTVRIADALTGKLIASPIRLPAHLKPYAEHLAVIGDRVLVGSPGYPILDVAALRAAPNISTESLKTIAELASGKRLVLGEQSSLSENELLTHWLNLDDSALSSIKRIEVDSAVVTEFQATKLAGRILQSHESHWTPLKNESLTSKGNATLKLNQGGEVLVSGNNVPGDVYTIVAATNATSVTAIKLEVLPDPSLPNNGPGRHDSGNFQLQEFRLSRQSSDTEPPHERIPLSDVWASYSLSESWAPDVDIEGTIRDDSSTVWHVWGKLGQPHEAIFQLSSPLVLTPNQRLVISLDHFAADSLNIGKFRLSMTTDKSAIRKSQLNGLIGQRQIGGTLALAAAHWVIGEPQEAIQTLSSLPSDTSPREATIRELLSANAHHDLQRPQLAREHYDLLLDRLPQHPLGQPFRSWTIHTLTTIGGLSLTDARAAMAASQEHRLRTGSPE